MKYVSDPTEAKGIVHEVFVALWEKYPALPVETNYRGYLFTAVRNRCLNYLRDNKKHVALEAVEDRSMSHEPDPMGTQELEREIELALNTMPDKCRQVFELNRAEGLKYAEIAEKLGISVKTVEAHMTKALAIMREHLGKFLIVLIYFVVGLG